MRTRKLFTRLSIFSLAVSVLMGCTITVPQPPKPSSLGNLATQAPTVTTIAILSPAEKHLPTDKSTPTISSRTEESLRADAIQHGLLIGAAVSADALNKDGLYGQTLAREFNLLTPENVMKFDTIHPSPTGYDFSAADQLVKFAQQNDMKIRGHTLVWSNQLPDWLTKGTFTRDQMIAILKDHIITVVGHYRGQVTYWDVVNEAVADDGSLGDTIWSKSIGPGYIDMAFQWAHEADPQARLIYNDFRDEDMGQKSNGIYALVQGMIQRGVPINGVGFQMHLDAGSPPPLAEMVKNMNRLGDLGLEVNITELDVRIRGNPSEKDLSDQADIYRNILQACLSVTNCKVFTLWGFSDRHSWISQFFPGYGSALIFDKDYNPKPAYQALLDVLTHK